MEDEDNPSNFKLDINFDESIDKWKKEKKLEDMKWKKLEEMEKWKADQL